VLYRGTFDARPRFVDGGLDGFGYTRLDRADRTEGDRDPDQV
jgi:hypothetical protein